MKLSEAIRLGAMLHPQHFGNMRRYERSDGKWSPFGGQGARLVATCALGAADEAGYPNVFASQFTSALAQCPACRSGHSALSGAIAHLNDDHRWTRERIADWVEQQELAGDAADVSTVITIKRAG